jgi:hypothetical protein
MLAAIVCAKMGWTWQEYRDQPKWFPLIILLMISSENKAINKRNQS